MAATVATGAFEGSYKFTGQEGPGKGKRMSNAATRQQLQWEPKYASYVQFMQQTKAQVRLAAVHEGAHRHGGGSRYGWLVVTQV
jgi:hypothetical protein